MFPTNKKHWPASFFFSDTIWNGCFSGINWGQIRYQVSALTQKPKSTFLPCLLKKLDFKPLHFIYGIITFWLWRTGRQRYNTHKHIKSNRSHRKGLGTQKSEVVAAKWNNQCKLIEVQSLELPSQNHLVH